MSVPYTPDAVKAIRHAFDTGRLRTEILDHLGWADAMFDRVCERHGINFARSSFEREAIPESEPWPPMQSAPLRRRVPRCRPVDWQPKDNVKITICVNENARAVIVQRARAADLSLSAAVCVILAEWVESGAAAKCGRYRGATRGEYITLTMSRPEQAHLSAAMREAGHPNLSEFCAAILQRHLALVVSQ